jgi:prepilin-type processing-associated H-X9-DG protein
MGETKILVCPTDDREPAGSFAELNNANLSYFVGLEADETQPRRFLAGDRNLTNNVPLEGEIMLLQAGQQIEWTAALHGNEGNIGMADGSVQQMSNERVRQAVKQTGLETNRLAMPVE